MMIQTENGQALEVPDGATSDNIDEILQHFYASQTPPSDDQRAANTLSETGNDIGDIFNRIMSSDPTKRLDPVQGGIQMLGKGIGGATAAISDDLGLTGNLETIGKGIKAGYNNLPSAFTSPINNAASSLKSAISDVYDSGVNALADTGIADKLAGNSELKKNMQDISDTAKSVIPTVTAGESLAKGASNAIKGVSDILGEGSGVSTNAALAGFPSGYEKLSPSVQNSAQINAGTDSLRDAKAAAYKNAEDLGAVWTPQASDHIGLTVPMQVQQYMKIPLDVAATPQTKSIINSLSDQSQSGLTTNIMEALRKRLNSVVAGNSSPLDKAAAQSAKGAIDNVYDQTEQNPDMLVNKDPSAIQAFRDAREANSIYQRHSDVADIVNDARGDPAKIQGSFRKMLQSKNEFDFNRYDPDEQKIIENIAYPSGNESIAQSTLPKAAKAIAKGAAYGAAFGGEGGFFVGSPVIGGVLGGTAGGAVASVAQLNAALKSAGILKGADNLLKTIASKSQKVGK